MGSVGRPDLAQRCSRRLHHIGKPEGAADLDQLAARDDRFAPLGERFERDQNGGGVVVDDDRRFRLRQPF